MSVQYSRSGLQAGGELRCSVMCRFNIVDLGFKPGVNSDVLLCRFNIVDLGFKPGVNSDVLLCVGSI